MSKGEKKKTAGILVMSYWQGKPVAVLLRRGKINHETMADETRPGGCQITAHGGLEEGENPLKGALRELAEEIGVGAAESVMNGCQKLNMGMTIWTTTEETETAFVTSVIVYVPDPAFVSIASFNGSSGGFEMLTEDQVHNIKNLRDYDKVTGVRDLYTIAMFPDESALVKKGFDLIRGV